MTKWTIPDASTFHRGQREFGSGFDMMRRIEALEAIILEALRAPDEDRTEILRKGVREGGE